MTTPANPATPATPATPAPSGAPAALTDKEVVDLLSVDDATPAVETPAAAVPADGAADTIEGEDGAEGEAAAGEIAAGEVTAGEPTETPAAAQADDATPKPGTPDKALQKLQQDLAAATRKIGELDAKLASGASLTGKEQQQLEQSKRKLDQVRETVKDTDWFEPTKVGEVATGLTDALTETDTTVRALQQQVDQLQETLGAMNAEKTWTTFQQQYPKVDVQAVWDKAVEDAAVTIGAENPALVRLASKLFHERSNAAAKSLAAKAPAKKGAATAPVTPGGAKVGIVPGLVASGAVNDEAKLMSDYMSLVATD